MLAEPARDLEGTGAAWTWEAFRARQANERANELKAQAQDETAKRDQALRDAAGAGCPTRELAKLAGVSRQLVYQVLGTEPEPRGG